LSDALITSGILNKSFGKQKCKSFSDHSSKERRWSYYFKLWRWHSLLFLLMVLKKQPPGGERIIANYFNNNYRYY